MILRSAGHHDDPTGARPGEVGCWLVVERHLLAREGPGSVLVARCE
jgi:hypothetical protein